MGELHSAIEECKADITGLWAAIYLMKSKPNLLSINEKKSMYVTYLASAFRSIRFGLHEAHGKGQAIQLNYILQHGGFIYDSKTMRFSVDFDKIDECVEGLVREIISLQGLGNKQRALDIMNTLGVISPEATRVMLNIEQKGIPIDIYPSYPIFE